MERFIFSGVALWVRNHFGSSGSCMFFVLVLVLVIVIVIVIVIDRKHARRCVEQPFPFSIDFLW